MGGGGGNTFCVITICIRTIELEYIYILWRPTWCVTWCTVGRPIVQDGFLATPFPAALVRGWWVGFMVSYAVVLGLCGFTIEDDVLRYMSVALSV